MGGLVGSLALLGFAYGLDRRLGRRLGFKQAATSETEDLSNPFVTSTPTSSVGSLPTFEGDDDAWDSGGMQQHAKQYNHREISTHEAL